MPTSPVASFASSIFRLWRNPRLHPDDNDHSVQKPPLATNTRSHCKEREPSSHGHQSRGKLHKAGRCHKRNRQSTVSDNTPPQLLPEAERVSLNNFTRAFRRQMDSLSRLPPTPPSQMEVIPEASEESDVSNAEAQGYHCESVYHTPTSSVFDFGDIPPFLNFTSDVDPPTTDPLTGDASPLLHEEILSLRKELEEIKRENQDLNAELAECYDYGRSLRELEPRYEQLLGVVMEANKTQRALTQNMASMTDDLRSVKHSQVTLEREADQLRWIIYYYQTSVQEAGISLAYQDVIDKHISGLDYPLQPPPMPLYQAGGADELPTIAEGSEDSSASSTPSFQKGHYIVTPPRTPNSGRVKSPKPAMFSPSAQKFFRPESPVKKDYIPREGSPLKFESRLCDEEVEADKRRLRPKTPSNGRISRLDYTESEYP